MIKVGCIQFTNALPLFLALQEKIIPHNAQIILAPASTINEKLQQKELDIALISSTAFLDQRFEYILLSDLGIAGTEKAISVRLFFNDETLQLDQRTVYVPATSSTSNRLFQVLCSSFWNATPILKPYSQPPEELFHQKDPFVLFGDDALNHYSLHTSFPSIDLCEAWNKATSKSFIFGVIATRNDSFQRKSQEIIAFHKALEESFAWAEQHPQEIIKKARQCVSCPEPLLQSYFQTLEYRLSPRHFQGLHYFSTLETKSCCS